MKISMIEVESPLGPIQIAATDTGVCLINFVDSWDRAQPVIARRFDSIEYMEGSDPHNARRRMRAYFEGEFAALDELPLDPGGTGFQQQVWDRVRKIPAGQTASYGAVAKDIGKPAAVRAVGAANGHNPLPLVVPCHRVIGASGELRGYGGGIERKRWLLAHEGVSGELFK
ncbi:MAG: methylated-DNA--[protein]-cysteine S-methyltransferase [Blastocatellia bacterium]